MGLTSDGIGLLFTLKASNEASPELKKFREDVEEETKKIKENGENVFTDLAKNIGLSSDQTAKLSAAMPVLGSAMTGVAAVAVGLVAAVAGVSIGLFNLAKSASEYAGEIFDAQLKTGTAAETLSALRFQAELSGTSFESVGKGLKNFALLMGEAEKGSEEAQAKLKALGVTSKDLDTAFAEAVKTIGSLDDEVQQNTAAADAFGKKLGSELIPLIRDINGDIPELIKNAKELGVTLTQEDIVAADKFGDSLDQLGVTARITATKFALQFAPVIAESLDIVDKKLVENQDRIVNYGKNVGDVLRGLKAVFESETTAMAASVAVMGAKIITYLDPVQFALIKTVNLLGDYGASQKKDSTGEPVEGGGSVREPSKSYTSNFSDAKAGKSAADARQKELDAQIKTIELDQKLVKLTFENSKKLFDELLKSEKITLTKYSEDVEKNLDEYIERTSTLLLQKRALLNQRFSGTDLTNAQKDVDAERENLISTRGLEILKTEKEITDRKIKNKEIEIKSILAFEKSQGEKEIALLQDNEAAYMRAKEGLAIKLLENEAGLLKGFLGNKVFAEILPESKREEIIERARNLENEIQTAKTNAAAAETKRRIEVTDNLQKQSDEATKRGNKNFVDGERERYELNLKFGRNRLANLIEYRDFELNQIKLEKDAADQKLIDEETKAKKSVEGFKNQKELEFQIEELYKQKRLISEEEFQRRKKEIEDSFNPAIREQASGEGAIGIISGGLGDLIGGGVDPSKEITEQADYLKAVYGDLRNVAKGAIGDMVGGLANLGAQWILTGKISGKAAAQMAAGVIAGIAIQAGIKALFELAEGYAALANPFTAYLAPMHFAAAKTYGLVAAGAGIAAVGLRLAIGNSGAESEGRGAFGSAGGGGGMTQGNQRGYTGGAYSGAGDDVPEYSSGINAPVTRHEITVGNESYIFDVLENNVSKGGRMHDLFRHLAGDPA